MAWNANDPSRRSQEWLRKQQQRRFERGNRQRAARQMSDLMAQYRLRRSSGAGPAPLTPEEPIGRLSAEPGTAPPAPLDSGGRESVSGLPPGWSGEIRGTVLGVVEPVVNVNPWLVVEMRTDSGETVTVRAWFFWGTIRAPHIAEGHHICVGGRLTRRGYIKPSYIIDDSTGSRWRQWLRLP